MKYLVGLLMACLCSLSLAQSLNSQSSAITNSTAGATNAGNSQYIISNSDVPSSTSVKTNPTVYAPSLGSGYSPLNCANAMSGGGSGGFFGLALGGPIESDQCNGRANATMLMQMSNNFRTFDAATAGKLSTAAINIMCDQDDKVRAKLAAQGLCDKADYAGNKRDYGSGSRAPTAYYPNTGG